MRFVVVARWASDEKDLPFLSDAHWYCRVKELFFMGNNPSDVIAGL